MARWLIAMLAWLAGVAIQLQQAELAAPVWVLAGAVLGVLTLLVPAIHSSVRQRRLPEGTRLVLMALGVLLLAWAATSWRAGVRVAQVLPDAWGGQEVAVEGRIDSLPERRADTWRMDVQVRRYNGQSVQADQPQQIMLFWRVDDARQPVITAGQVWLWRVRLQRPVGVSNPGGFDQALWLFERGVRATGSVRPRAQAPVLLREPAGWLDGGVDRLRQRIREALFREVSDARLAGVLAGLTVGDQAAIDPDDWNVFRQTGVAHLVSISGLHIAMVGWMIGGLAAALWRRSPGLVLRRPAPVVGAWGMVIGALAYAVLAGWGVPAQRTVCMMLVSSVLRLSGRRWPWPMVWLSCAVVVTLLDPWALSQAGFWLSFVAVGVLMSSGPEPRDHEASAHWRSRLWQHIRQGVRTQWLATVGLLPLGVVFFQQVSLVGFLANLLAIPWFTMVITPLALLGMVWPWAWHPAAATLDMSLALLTRLANWPWAVWQTPMLPGWLGASAVAAACLMVMPLPRAWRWLGWPVLLPILYLPAAWGPFPLPAKGQFMVLAPDIGQGTAVIIRTASHVLLFDAGPQVGPHDDAGRRVVVPVLQALGVRRLDEVVLSHGDADHTGGALSVGKAMEVSQWRTTLADEHVVRVAQNAMPHPPRHVVCQAGQRWEWDGVSFEVLQPDTEELRRRAQLSDNALSCVVRVASVGRRGSAPRTVLLTGDIEADQEAALLQRDAGQGHLASTLLVAPHHGSRTSSTEPFVRAVAPTTVLIQAGRHNRYGHPARDVVARYVDQGVEVSQSARCGAFAWRSDTGQHECWLDRARHYWN